MSNYKYVHLYLDNSKQLRTFNSSKFNAYNNNGNEVNN